MNMVRSAKKEEKSAHNKLQSSRKSNQTMATHYPIHSANSVNNRGIEEHDSIAIKHTAAVHVSNTLSLLQRKAANVLLKYAYRDLSFREIHQVKLSELARDLGWSKTSNANEKLKDAIRTLNVTQVEWNILGKDNKHEWGVATILAEAVIKDGYCTYAYSPTMRKLQSNPNLYARLDLVVQQAFDRCHTLALWEYLTEALCSAQSNYIETQWLPLETFRRLMGVNTTYYHNYSKLNSKVILPALEEINEKSDVESHIRTKRDGRTITEVSFIVKRKETHALPPALLEERLRMATMGQMQAAEIIQKDLGGLLCATLQHEFAFPPKVARKLVKELGNLEAAPLEITLERIRKRQEEGGIKNLQAYVATALKEGMAELLACQPSLPGVMEETIQVSEKEGLHPIWQEVRKKMKDQIGESVYQSWIHGLELQEILDDKIILKADNTFVADWVSRNYIQSLLELWRHACPEINEIKIIAQRNAAILAR